MKVAEFLKIASQLPNPQDVNASPPPNPIETAQAAVDAARKQLASAEAAWEALQNEQAHARAELARIKALARPSPDEMYVKQLSEHIIERSEGSAGSGRTVAAQLALSSARDVLRAAEGELTRLQNEQAEADAQNGTYVAVDSEPRPPTPLEQYFKKRAPGAYQAPPIPARTRDT